jgi:hypothetical protein
MANLHHAQQAIDRIAADRRARGAHIPPDHIEAAAALLLDLWAAAARHGIGADHLGHTLHLPRAALDTVGARARRRLRGA